MVLDAADLSAVCSATEIAGPGFINITFSNSFLASELAVAAADTRLGVRLSPAPEVVDIDYSAPNVAKEMHVGHLRSTVIGDALVRMLEFVGHRVIRENHIGDWGTPFGMLIEHLIDLGEAEAANELSVGDLDSFYRQARTKFDASDEFKERARARVVLLQGGDDETLRMWKLLVGESTRYFDRVYRVLDVLLTSDDIMGESAYNHLLAEVVERLKKSGMLQTSDGAEVVFVDGFVNRDNEPLPLIIRKTDGGYNYATSALACVIDRVERLGATRILYVVGAPQAQHLEMVGVVSRKAGWVPETTQMVHVAFGNVLGNDRKILKSRSGEVVKLDALLTEAVDRAGVSVREKNAELSAGQQGEIARQVGIGAIKYADLSTDRNSKVKLPARWALVQSSTPTCLPTESRITSLIGSECCRLTEIRRPICSMPMRVSAAFSVRLRSRGNRFVRSRRHLSTKPSGRLRFGYCSLILRFGTRWISTAPIVCAPIYMTWQASSAVSTSTALCFVRKVRRKR